MSSVIVAKVSVILVFKFVISETGVENKLSLTYTHKKKSREVIPGDRGGQGVGPSLPIHLFGNDVSKNQMLQLTRHKILKTKVMVKKYVFIPRSFLVINVCNQGKILCSPCIIVF